MLSVILPITSEELPVQPLARPFTVMVAGYCIFEMEVVKVDTEVFVEIVLKVGDPAVY